MRCARGALDDPCVGNTAPPAHALEHERATVIRESIQKRVYDHDVAERPRAVLERTVRRDGGGGLLSAAQEGLGERICGVGAQRGREDSAAGIPGARSRRG